MGLKDEGRQPAAAEHTHTHTATYTHTGGGSEPIRAQAAGAYKRERGRAQSSFCSGLLEGTELQEETTARQRVFFSFS